VKALIDPEELPFTADEVFRAGCRFLTVTDARAMAKHLAACGADIIAERTARRAKWQAAGVPGANTMSLDAWVYPEALLPALAAGSVDAEARARRLMERYWAGLRSALVRAAQRAAFTPPTPAMEAAADENVAERRAAWDAAVARFRGADGGGFGPHAL
jgi:hypothetical protein